VQWAPGIPHALQFLGAVFSGNSRAMRDEIAELRLPLFEN
jgi:hypothetical protein